MVISKALQNRGIIQSVKTFEDFLKKIVDYNKIIQDQKKLKAFSKAIGAQLSKSGRNIGVETLKNWQKKYLAPVVPLRRSYGAMARSAKQTRGLSTFEHRQNVKKNKKPKIKPSRRPKKIKNTNFKNLTKKLSKQGKRCKKINRGQINRIDFTVKAQYCNDRNLDECINCV